jgi:4-hydroxy-tetrahydrodipicolinate synthase
VNKISISGSIVALVTPMTSSGEVDYQDLDGLISLHLDNQTDGIVVLGTTGESVTLDDDEKEKIVKRVLARVAGRIPVIVGTGDNCTKRAIAQSKKAKEWGADAILVVTPYYNKPSQLGLVAHYQAIHNEVDIPIILYNVPGRTACDLKPETTALLAQEKNIIAIKEASSDPNRINELVKLCPASFSLLSGEDEALLSFLKAGGHGIISVTSNVVPDKIAAICKAAVAQDWEVAEQINNQLTNLHKNLFISSNPVPVKWVLYHLGYIKSDQCRLPLLPLEQQYYSKIITALEQARVAKFLDLV